MVHHTGYNYVAKPVLHLPACHMCHAFEACTLSANAHFCDLLRSFARMQIVWYYLNATLVEAKSANS